MQEWVDANYPGTKLAITEYNWGGLEHINGALAQADVLGIFGREGLDLATLWGPPDDTEPGAYAFRMYRNYDGTGSGFGDTSVKAASADQDFFPCMRRSAARTMRLRSSQSIRRPELLPAMSLFRTLSHSHPQRFTNTAGRTPGPSCTQPISPSRRPASAPFCL